MIKPERSTAGIASVVLLLIAGGCEFTILGLITFFPPATYYNENGPYDNWPGPPLFILCGMLWLNLMGIVMGMLAFQETAVDRRLAYLGLIGNIVPVLLGLMVCALCLTPKSRPRNGKNKVDPISCSDSRSSGIMDLSRCAIG